MHLKSPFRVHNVYSHLSWLDRANVEQPHKIVKLQEALQSNEVDIEVRETADIERLLDSRSYSARRAVMKAFTPIDRFFWKNVIHRLGQVGRKLFGQSRWQQFRSRLFGLQS